MTRTDQVTFIQNLCRSIESELVDKVQKGIIPETWDGIELRELLAHKFDCERLTSMRDRRRPRTREFWNVIATTNI